MSQWKETFEKISANDDFKSNIQLLTFILANYQRDRKFIKKEDLPAIVDFVFFEIKRLLNLIPKASTFKIKDELFSYEDKIMGLVTILMTEKYSVSNDLVNEIKALVLLVSHESVPRTAIDKMFDFEKIEKIDIMNVLEVVRGISDEYQRGLIYQGLLEHKDKISKFTKEAKEEIAKFFCEEFENYLKSASLAEEEVDNLEIAADVCKYFADDKLLDLLEKILVYNHACIRFYAIDTLIKSKRPIKKEIIADMAKDLEYADLTHGLLMQNGLISLFPSEYNNPEYLAKSNMVRWLVYPTELGKMPNIIEFIGVVRSSGEDYYVFKYKSNSDNLEDELKNIWLIGWASNDGGTFSHFTKLSEVEHKNPKKTLKLIKKKLIG